MVTLTSVLTSLPLSTTGGTHGTGTMAAGFFPLFPFFGLLVMLLVFGLVAYVIYGALQPGESRSPDRTDDALALLRQRYASGEIDEDEYRTRKAQLIE